MTRMVVSPSRSPRPEFVSARAHLLHLDALVGRMAYRTWLMAGVWRAKYNVTYERFTSVSSKQSFHRLHMCYDFAGAASTDPAFSTASAALVPGALRFWTILYDRQHILAHILSYHSLTNHSPADSSTTPQSSPFQSLAHRY
jgi:hypothetical protein